MPQFDRNNLPSPTDFRHRTDLQIRFNDIDILGHLNNTVYFSFYDTGKAYYLEAVNHGRMNWQRVESVIANVDCAFIAPCFFGEPIEILTRCEHLGDKSLTLLQMIINKDTAQVKSICRTVMVAYNPDTGQSTMLSPSLRQCISEYEAHDFSTSQAVTQP